jgi:hypothetical protein
VDGSEQHCRSIAGLPEQQQAKPVSVRKAVPGECHPCDDEVVRAISFGESAIIIGDVGRDWMMPYD